MTAEIPLFKNGQSLRQVRADFPLLARQINVQGETTPVPLVYLDNAATAQKPETVIHIETRYYETTNANVHRALHTLGEQATEKFELARERVRSFIGAEKPSEIIFTRNTTESINLVAQSWGGKER